MTDNEILVAVCSISVLLHVITWVVAYMLIRREEKRTRLFLQNLFAGVSQ